MATGKKIIMRVTKALKKKGGGEIAVVKNSHGYRYSTSFVKHMDRWFYLSYTDDGEPFGGLMFRTAEGPKDFKGGQNNFVSGLDADAAADRILDFMRKFSNQKTCA